MRELKYSREIIEPNESFFDDVFQIIGKLNVQREIKAVPGESGGFPTVIHLVKEDGEWKINDGDVSISPSVQPH